MNDRQISVFSTRIIHSFLVLFLLVCTPAALANTLKSLRIWPSPDETRVVIDLKSEAEYSYFTLSSPYRIVVDLKNTTLNTKLPITLTKSKVLKQIRKSSSPKKGTFRLVFETTSKVTPKLFKLAPTPGGQYGYRLVVDLPHSNAQPVSATPTPPSRTSSSKDVSQLVGNADIIVAIDAGHGGEDPGSIGPTRKYEKHATLSIAKKIADRLNNVSGIKTVMTRRGDYFLNLNKRSAIARSNKAHLLVSIHADSFRSSQPRGASVFVLNTRRANTEIARWVEKHEEQSELLGGAGEVLSKNNADRNVSQTLLDLQFSHSQKEGYKVATNILYQLGKVTRLHKKEPVHASLAVLKSPDIPSVLVETGFISNPTEEKLLFQKEHQTKVARALTNAIVQYFEANPPEGTLFAQRKSAKKHKVVRGDSLSAIAQKYGSSTRAIMSANNLKSTGLRVGQVLIIPASSYSAPKVSTSTATASVPAVQHKVITHTVASGEYLSKIATKYKVSVASIKQQNKLKRDTLWVGQKLKISVKVTDLPIQRHIVKRGEFLSKIASRYGVSVAAIRKANNLRSDALAIGQKLIIPNK